MKKNKKITLLNSSPASLPAKADEFLKYFTDIVNTAPKEYRKDVLIDIDIEEDYGSYYTSVDIHYHRPETDEEETERREKERSDVEDNIRRTEERLVKFRAELEEI